MPINPSIITSGNQMAPVQLPDVNTMMQTRTAGMENTYKLERQREADAAAQAKAQEEAAVQAVLPAYAHVFRTGDLAGGMQLVPPNLRAKFQPLADALAGKPLEEVQAAVAGSLVTTEAGRAFLENEARMRTAGIQQGQLDVSREDIKLRRQKQALDAQGQGAWELKEGEGGFFWTNPRTREVVPADVTGTAVPGAVPGPTPIPAPDVVTPRQPAPGMPEVAAPAVAGQTPAEQPKFRPKPKAASTEQSQEERRRAASVRYTVKNADRVAEIIDKNPAAFGEGADEFLLSLLPFEAGENFKAFVQDADRQQLNYRMTQIVATLLRLETGAAYTKPELVTDAASFMQKYGDQPETARDKIDALKDRVSSAVGSTGRAWTSEDQAEYDAAMSALDAIKDKLYPVSGAAEGEAAVNSVREGATATNPQTGERLIYRDGQWQPL